MKVEVKETVGTIPKKEQPKPTFVKFVVKNIAVNIFARYVNLNVK